MTENLSLLDRLTDALGDSDGLAVEEIKEELREEGFAVDESIERLKEWQQKLSAFYRGSNE